MPFQNIGGDAEQDYFADGVVEDIIIALSRFKSFAVIARNSSFVYKGKAVDVREAARDLGVRYVLSGSVRRAGHLLDRDFRKMGGEPTTALAQGLRMGNNPFKILRPARARQQAMMNFKKSLGTNPQGRVHQQIKGVRDDPLGGIFDRHNAE